MCDWATSLSQAKAGPGSTCSGSPLMLNGCASEGPMCLATVSEYRGLPLNILDWAGERSVSDLLIFAFSMSDFTRPSSTALRAARDWAPAS